MDGMDPSQGGGMDLMDGMGRVNEIGLGGRRAECSFRARAATCFYGHAQNPEN